MHRNETEAKLARPRMHGFLYTSRERLMFTLLIQSYRCFIIQETFVSIYINDIEHLTNAPSCSGDNLQMKMTCRTFFEPGLTVGGS
jgi:hypothetical protein